MDFLILRPQISPVHVSLDVLLIQSNFFFRVYPLMFSFRLWSVFSYIKLVRSVAAKVSEEVGYASERSAFSLLSGIHLPASEESGKVQCNAFELGSELLLKTVRARARSWIIQMISNICFSAHDNTIRVYRSCKSARDIGLSHEASPARGKDVNVASLAFAETRFYGVLLGAWCISSSTCYFDEPITFPPSPSVLIYWIEHTYIPSATRTHTYTFSRVHFPRVFPAFDVKYFVPLLLVSFNRDLDVPI